MGISVPDDMHRDRRGMPARTGFFRRLRAGAAAACRATRLPAVSNACRLRRDRGGAVALLAALTMTMVCGLVGLAIDVGVWYRAHQAMQHAADAAAIAAARDGGANYEQTGRAVAARYGFVHGADNIQVFVKNAETCPNGSPNCYRATVLDAAAQQYFTKVMRIPAPPLATTAVASPANSGSVCLFAREPTGTAIQTKGTPKADLGNCEALSNSNADCDGHGLGAKNVYAAGTADLACGTKVTSNVKPLDDPYEKWKRDIPSGACTETAPTWNNAKITLGAVKIVCGGVSVVGNVEILTTSPGSILVIRGGSLKVSGTLTTTGPGLTVIFTGTDNSKYLEGEGSVGITAPKPNPSTGIADYKWLGFAVYVDPAKPRISFDQTGNSPSWNISGLVYMPEAIITIKGAVNKNATGDCFAMVVYRITLKGTGLPLKNGSCAKDGLLLPTIGGAGGTPALVL